MRRYFEFLSPADVSAIHSVEDGLFLVRVDRAQYRWHKQKPYYEMRFVVLKPKHLTGCLMTGRLYCATKAMWKLRWFLRDFGYDPGLLERNEIDDKALVDLWGVVKVSEVMSGCNECSFGGKPQSPTTRSVSSSWSPAGFLAMSFPAGSNALGVPEKVIQQILRHANVSTTATY